MSIHTTHLPYTDTGYFSKLVTDYLEKDERLKSLYAFETGLEGIKAAIAARTKYPVNRKVLTDVLRRQYSTLTTSEKTAQNIELLEHENTFTICTAHQPNLLTGYLYFIYKIVHAIKLAEELNQHFPNNKFVPIYYMGSEDNDLDELGTFRYNDKKFAWDAAGQTGAVGRMDTQTLKPLLDELFKLLGPPGENTEALKQLLTDAYLSHKDITSATQYLVNELFGKFGLIVLNPDEAELKRAFINVMKDDLLQQTAFAKVSAQITEIEAHYNAQAHPRPINLFYLKDNMRERIEKKGKHWQVLNTSIQFTETELLHELDNFPERFSPNVILRGMYQETILPDVAFIGGGAEVAYWLELKTIFEHYDVYYPVVLLRQSVIWIAQNEDALRTKLGLSIADIFKPEIDLVKNYILKNGADKWQTGDETKQLEQLMEALRQKATSLDPTLRSSAEAALAKMRHQLQVLEKKMLRAEKRKMQDQLLRIAKLKNILFPNNGLQERIENFSGYYIKYGSTYVDILKDAMQPLKNEFLVIEDKS